MAAGAHPHPDLALSLVMLEAPLVVSPPSPLGIGVGSYVNFIKNYGFVHDGPTLCAVNGKASWVKPLAHGEDPVQGSPVAIPVLHFLYVPYMCRMLASSLLNQIYFIFIHTTLQGGLRSLALISAVSEVASFVGGACLAPFKAMVDRRKGWVVDILLLGTQQVAFAISQDVAVVTFVSAFFAFIGSFGGWISFERDWVEKNDQPHGANLRVLMRYFTAAVGPPLGLLVAAHPALGGTRGTYGLSAAMFFVLACYACRLLRLARVEDSVMQLQGNDQRHKAVHISQWHVARMHCKPLLAAGFFSVFTEVVRSGYAQTLNLKALETLTISQSDTAISLFTCNVVASMFGLLAPKLVLDGRIPIFGLCSNGAYSVKRAAIPSFATLALGHLLLAFSISRLHIICAGVVFGLGEGLSAGLRVIVNNNAAKAVEAQSEGNEDYKKQKARLFIMMVGNMNKLGTWSNALSPLLGHWQGMQVVSLTYAGIGCAAALFASAVDLEGPEDQRTGRSRNALAEVELRARIILCPCGGVY